MTRPLALVTGASSGIGTACALELSAAGYDLVLVARRRDRLEALQQELTGQGAGAEVVVADLSDRAGLAVVVERGLAGDVDVLVSNAGVSAYGPFAQLPFDDLERASTLNMDATPLLVRAVLPGMLERDRGGVITVASNLAFSAGLPSGPTAGQGRGLPQRALYAGAKAGLLAFTRTLAGELAGTGVSATVVCPGLVSSEWNQGASQVPGAMTPEDVARAAWSSFISGEVVCLPGHDDPGVIAELAAVERTILTGNLGSELAPRYRR
jgi:short-subunit dehydrogenase